jgi:hypothetical protein
MTDFIFCVSYFDEVALVHRDPTEKRILHCLTIWILEYNEDVFVIFLTCQPKIYYKNL